MASTAARSSPGRDRRGRYDPGDLARRGLDAGFIRGLDPSRVRPHVPPGRSRRKARRGATESRSTPVEDVHLEPFCGKSWAAIEARQRSIRPASLASPRRAHPRGLDCIRRDRGLGMARRSSPPLRVSGATHGNGETAKASSRAGHWARRIRVIDAPARTGFGRSRAPSPPRRNSPRNRTKALRQHD